MTNTSIDEKMLMHKLHWKIIPFIFVLYMISIVDRVNIGFAALQMNKALGITAATFGLMAGIFFIAYFFFEVPSNVLMYKYGARRWLTRILVSWGFVVILMGFIQTATHLLILRALLGVAEAGFYPSMILYLTYWFPERHQARAISIFMCGQGVSNIVGGPICSLIMDNVHWLGMAGWRWVFVFEGIPAVVFGIITFFVLTDSPEEAKFLTENEKTWLIDELKHEKDTKVKKNNISKWDALKNARVWRFCITYLCYVMALYGLSLWLPQIIKGMGASLTNTQIGFISTIPYIFGLVGMILVGKHSDKTSERRYHVGVPMFVAAVGLILVTFSHSLVISILLISIVTGAIYAFVGSFWTLPNMVLTGSGAAVGIAWINSIGNLGGFVGPYMVGYLKQVTHSTSAGMYMLAVFAVLGGILIVTLPKKDVTVINDKDDTIES